MRNNRNFFFLTVISLTAIVTAQLACSDESLKTKKENVEAAKVLLGRYLFYDRRLSVNNTKACATCHAQEFSFTDNYTRSIGAMGDLHQRNSRPLINLAAAKTFTAADTSIQSVLSQMNGPMFNKHPIEMGMDNNDEYVQKKIGKDENYKSLFADAFPKQQHFSITQVKESIAAFVLTIESRSSNFDFFRKGGHHYLNEQEKRGYQLFLNLQCNQCHSGKDFNQPIFAQSILDNYQNIGLYNIMGSYPKQDIGLEKSSKASTDNGKFRIPTLRNLKFTGPYFHDGSANSLLEVIDVYEMGGRTITEGINKGDGRKHPNKNARIKGFTLTLQDKQALVAFLLSVSDSSIITNPAYANPFNYDETK